jgi:hypothetical protein
MSTPLTVAALLVPLADKMPEPEDVKAGWLGFAVFLALAAVVAFLAFSLRKHLGRVNFEERDKDAPSHDGSTETDATNGDHPDPDDTGVDHRDVEHTNGDTPTR